MSGRLRKEKENESPLCLGSGVFIFYFFLGGGFIIEDYGLALVSSEASRNWIK